MPDASDNPENLNEPTSGDAGIVLRTHGSIHDIGDATWQRLANPEPDRFNPFVSYAFLSSLEDSGSVGAEAGWHPCHFTLEDQGRIIGIAAAYLKGHSQGEYIFDHHWADAYERAGGRYYPKLLLACPFTPVPGPRLLCTNDHDRKLLANAIAQFTAQSNLSSTHVNFVETTDRNILTEQGYLLRVGEQFHWHNHRYKNFDDFLDTLSSRKRKTIRQERRKACRDDIEICQITSNDLTEELWDSFWGFYQDTGARKWGTPYLTRDAFSLLGQRMANQILLVFAYRQHDPEPIAGALHMIGGDTLYGRYWGCREDARFLHFECCYYQAIDFAIKNGLSRIEAGAQGHHKIARGYEPVETYSAHYIPNHSFRQAIADYLRHERAGIQEEIESLKAFTPFKNKGAQ